MTRAKFFLILILGLLLGCQRGATPVASDPTRAPSATASATPTTAEQMTLEPTQLVLDDEQLLELARQTAAALIAAEHPEHDYYRMAANFRGLRPEHLTPQAPDQDWKLNDRANFFLTTNLAGSYEEVPARLRYLSENAAWWTGVTVRASDGAIAAAAERFEAEILPLNRLIFGKEWSPGIDNDARIHILLVEEPTLGFYGYFSHINEFPGALQPFSNEKEMFVMNLGGVGIDSIAFAGELAHEYHHLIHWSKDPNEDLWLNEAISELAVFLSGAPEASSAVGETNAELFAKNPHIQLTSRPERPTSSQVDLNRAHYAAERLFSIYLLEQLGARFIKDLVSNPNPGVLSIQQEMDKLPEGRRFEDVYANWLVANLLDQPDLLAGQFGYEEYQSLLPHREVIRSFRGQPLEGRLPPYGARYYEVRSDGPVKVSFRGEDLAPLTAIDPATGNYAWYSNRGDNSAFSLTRSFDLTNLEAATLNYKIWHELDEFYDYAYLEISADGGESWSILPSDHGTEQNPYDQAYGAGYTGRAMGWLDESIDLTPYTGKHIQIRFEVLTDFTINRDGVVIDDIEIPELGYFDGAEDDSGSWEARGFIRSSNFVPVEWVFWLIKLGNPIEIERIEVMPGETVEFEIQGLGEEIPFAAVAVSPTALQTTSEVNYELIFELP
jgi:hypothetical protein